ncbi:MAG: TerB N-terminal domain-containing protein [Thermosynechococcaceae cyanobacterium]
MLNWLKKLFPDKLKPTEVASVLDIPQQNSPVPLPPEIEPETVSESRPQTARWVFPRDASGELQINSTRDVRTSVDPSSSVTIATYTLTDGMIYVGDTLSGVSDTVSIEPCLICPQLKVDSDNPDRAGHWMTHWPSYREIPSACRAAYLEWLADGRHNPEIHISYVFLFLYGLERRVLHDLKNATGDCSAELTQIMAEVERLIMLYGHNESFLRDAGNFLDICWLLQSPQGLANRTPSTESLPLQLTLGKLAQAKQPLPSDWTLAWVLSLSRSSVVATHCLPELQSLFKGKYHQQFGDGIVLDGSAPTTALTRTYQPSSVSFGGPIDVIAELPELPDQSASLEALQPLVATCIEALEPYGRWLSRNLDQRGSLAAVLLLPNEIAHSHEHAEVNQLRRWATDSLKDHEFQVIAAATLLQRWTSEPVKKLAKADAVTLAQFLERQEMGLEPDVRFGGKPPKKSQNIVLFRCLNGVLAETSSHYSTAQLLLHLAAMIVTATDQINGAGMAHVQKYLAWTPRLQEPERDRLLAHFQWLCHNKLTLRGLKSRLEALEEERRGAIATFLISIVKATENQPAAIESLTKLYPLLGFEAEQVYQHLHSTDPIALQPTVSAVEPDPADAPAVGLNLDLIQRRQDESQTVSAMLADIFVEPEVPTPAPTKLGLDAAHSTFLLTLAQQPHWHREDLERVAAELNLLLDGALENINEIAFEQCDEALIEGEEPLEINSDILEELLAD